MFVESFKMLDEIFLRREAFPENDSYSRSNLGRFPSFKNLLFSLRVKSRYNAALKWQEAGGQSPSGLNETRICWLPRSSFLSSLLLEKLWQFSYLNYDQCYPIAFGSIRNIAQIFETAIHYGSIFWSTIADEPPTRSACYVLNFNGHTHWCVTLKQAFAELKTEYVCSKFVKLAFRIKRPTAAAISSSACLDLSLYLIVLWQNY